jgi:hypothetical protein
MLDYSSTAQRLLVFNSSSVIEPTNGSSSESIPMAEAVVKGAEVSLQAVEDPAAATANPGSGALAGAGVEADAEQKDNESQMEPTELQPTAANMTALDSSALVCTGEDSSQADPHSSAAVQDAAQQESQQHHESGLQLAAASDAAGIPAESTAAAMVLQMAADMLQAAEAAAAQAVEIAASNAAAIQPAAAAADAVAAAADAEDAVQQPAETASVLLVNEAAVPAVDVAVAAPVIAVLDGSVAEDGGSATAAPLDFTALAALGNPQKQQQQHEQLEAAGVPTTVESDAAGSASTAAEAAAAALPIWPPGVYLTPQMAQLLNEHGELQRTQRRTMLAKAETR